MYWSLEMSATHRRGGLATSSNLPITQDNDGSSTEVCCGTSAKARYRLRSLQCNDYYHYYDDYYYQPQFFVSSRVDAQGKSFDTARSPVVHSIPTTNNYDCKSAACDYISSRVKSAVCDTHVYFHLCPKCLLQSPGLRNATAILATGTFYLLTQSRSAVCDSLLGH